MSAQQLHLPKDLLVALREGTAENLKVPPSGVAFQQMQFQDLARRQANVVIMVIPMPETDIADMEFLGRMAGRASERRLAGLLEEHGFKAKVETTTKVINQQTSPAIRIKHRLEAE